MPAATPTPLQGVFTKLGIDTNATVTKRFDFHRESVRKRSELIDGNGLRGTRELDKTRVRESHYTVGGSISLEPNAVELALLLPWILGANASGTTYALAETLPERYVVIDRISKVFSYTGCKVDRATFRAARGEPLSLDLEIVGKTQSKGNAGTFPAIEIDTTGGGPFIFTDMVLDIGGTTYNAADFALTVSNMLDRNRHFNSPTLTAVATMGRSITLANTLPYGDAEALLGAGTTGVAATATFTNGTVSIAFTMPAVIYPHEDPVSSGRNEIMLPIEGQAYRSGSTDSLTVTLDSTP